MFQKLASKIPRLLFLLTASYSCSFSQDIGIYADTTVGQIKFAVSDIQAALSKKNLSSQIMALSALSALSTVSALGSPAIAEKVVISLSNNSLVTNAILAQGGTLPLALGKEAYALRTTTQGQKTFWVFGGDNNGAMYGGLQMAENITFSGLTGTYNNQESPAVEKRGIKLNIPLDDNSQTYGSRYTSAKIAAIPNVWDMNFWTTWFDEMARHRYNVISLWSNHPFTSMIKMEDYPLVAIQNVTGYKANETDITQKPALVLIKTMSIDDKIVFWKKVMAYAKARGFSFFLFNWNTFADGAVGKYGIKDDDTAEKDPATIKYMRACMSRLWETYPDLAGFGITQGESMGPDEAVNSKFLANTYGLGTVGFAKANPDRKITFIHRWHLAEFTEIKSNFAELFKLPNITFEMSFKYSLAHMYSSALPQRMDDKEDVAPLVAAKLRSNLTVRNDDFYYHSWGDPDFSRAYINGMINKGSWFAGFYMGSDGYTPTRTFFSKNSISQGQLEIQRQWYMFMLWGRLSYNPKTSDDVFKNAMASRFTGVSGENMFSAWQKASRGLTTVGDLITGTLGRDNQWWPEACQTKETTQSLLTIADFASAEPTKGSQLASIATTATGQLGGKKSALVAADEMEADAKSALGFLSVTGAPANTELGVTLNNIRSLSYLSSYYAFKIRGAVFNKAGNKKAEATKAMGEAYCWWIDYTNLMDANFTGMTMPRTKDLLHWHASDDQALKEYNDLGGAGKPACPDRSTSVFMGNLKSNSEISIRAFIRRGLVFTMPEGGIVRISVFNTSGKMVLQETISQAKKGLNELMFAKRLGMGLHFVQIKAAHASTVGRIKMTAME